MHAAHTLVPLALLVAAATAGAQTEITPVLINGQPGPFPGSLSDIFETPAISDNGLIAGLALISNTPPTGTTTGAIAYGPAGALAYPAFGTGPVPGAPGETFSSLLAPLINAQGDVTFQGIITLSANVDDSNRRGIWFIEADTPTLVEPVVRGGAPAPGTLSSFGFIDGIRLNNAGQVCFFASVDGPDVIQQNNRGIWTTVPGFPEFSVLRARGRDQAGDLNAFIDQIFPEFTVFSDGGEIVFLARLFGGDVTDFTNDSALLYAGPSGLEVLQYETEPAPGLPFNFGGIGSEYPSINASGVAAFYARLDGADRDADTTIYRGMPDNLELVLREGDEMPGMPGVFIDEFSQRPLIADNGDVILTGSLTGAGVTPDNAGVLLRCAPGSITIIFRNGDLAPGTALTFSGGVRFAIGRSGRVHFTANLGNSSVGLFAEGDPSAPVLVARIDETVDIDPSPMAQDLRTVAVIESGRRVSGADGRQVYFSTNDDVVFEARFDDSTSGIFLANVGASACFGDFDQDGDVDLGDFGVFGAAFGSTSSDPNYNPLPDFDSNGLVDLGDLGVFGAFFGSTGCPN